MTKTITKRADELKPGDLFNIGVDKCIATDHPRRAPSNNLVDVSYLLEGRLSVLTQRFNAEASFEVESSQLVTREQLDLLLDIAQSTLDGFAKPDRFKVKALLDEFRPPEPPTLEEALELLGQAINATREGYEPLDRRISQLLDRARRSGKL